MNIGTFIPAEHAVIINIVIIPCIQINFLYLLLKLVYAETCVTAIVLLMLIRRRLRVSQVLIFDFCLYLTAYHLLRYMEGTKFTIPKSSMGVKYCK